MASIEKNGGCNHMVCRKCKTDFCWACLQALGAGQVLCYLFFFVIIVLIVFFSFLWSPNSHVCNRYDEGDARSNSASQARAALQRYLFYYNRYMNHMDSLRLENKLYAAVEEKMEEMQQHNMTWVEVCLHY